MKRSFAFTVLLTTVLATFLAWQLYLSFADPPLRPQGVPDFRGNDGNVLELPQDGEGGYLLGVGKADITGPVVEINMMGYADMNQVGSGLRQRLYCRAFIIGSRTVPTDRIAYLVLDTQSGDTAIRNGILEGLAGLGPRFAVYTKDNVAVTGTHSHAGPGAWLNYLLPQITSKGFSRSSYEAIVQGSILAIQRAHTALVPGQLSLGTTELHDTNINRSPFSYEANPREEQNRYASNVDKTMTLLRLDRASDNQPLGVLSWFAVHGTSLYGNNTLIAGDNKGVASYLFEREMSLKYPGFVAGFSQANVGDSSPSVLGAFCEDTGFPCRHNDSTCDGNIKTCRGRGPYYSVPDQGTKSCFEIGRRQYHAAKSIFNDVSTNLRRLSVPDFLPVISSLHTFVDLSDYTFPSYSNASLLLHTCPAALGHSFASGTFDGPGAFDFKQGTTNSSDSPSQKNPLWKAARAFVHEPSSAQIACQNPKPILLDVGNAKKPYAWTPNIVDIQLLRVGPLVIIVSPGEATTMSGRRWREATLASAQKTFARSKESQDTSANSEEEFTVVLGGPANSYTHYIATESEYSVQRYEGASTLYGPHTLAAYINLTLTHLPHLSIPNSQRHPIPPPGPNPPINVDKALSFINPVVFDTSPLFKSFGSVLASPAPPPAVHKHGSILRTRFVGANPRNNLRLEGTFVAVEKKSATDGSWVRVLDDADWFLVMRWERKSTVLGTSEVTVEWEVEEGIEAGIYRMRYWGDSKGIGGKISAFEGIGGEFWVG